MKKKTLFFIFSIVKLAILFGNIKECPAIRRKMRTLSPKNKITTQSSYDDAQRFMTDLSCLFHLYVYIQMFFK